MNASFARLAQWLAPLDRAPVECDGMARAVSTLLQREKIPHKLLYGRLHIEGVGDIRTHFWIQFPEGQICDFRARMWLGDAPDVPHGIFQPTAKQQYHATAEIAQEPLATVVFHIMTGLHPSQFGSALLRTTEPRNDFTSF